MRLILLFAAALALRSELRQDIEFARVDNVSLTLDASIPEGGGPFPTVIVVHGGGFVRGDKQTYVKPLFPVLTDAGFTWFTINYRLAPQHTFPAQTEDVERAIAWIRKNSREYKVDTNRIALVGESAGGHLVSYVGTGRKPSVNVVVPFYAPHDLLARAEQQGSVSENIRNFLGIEAELTASSRKRLREASPVAHIHNGMPPYLLIHGTKDAQVDYSQSVKMCEAMKRIGASCELYTVQNGAHGMGGWDKIDGGPAYKRKLVDWLKEKLR